MIQLLKPEDHYSQRNNILHPTIACMPTSRAMFYIANNIGYVNPSPFSTDDFFMSLMLTDAAEETKKEKYSWAVGIPAHEVHGMYHSFLDPLVCKKRTSDFIELTWVDYVIRIRTLNQSIMTSMAGGGLEGHAIVFTGYDDETRELIFSDPWGDYKTNYVNQSGYGCRMNKEEFIQHVKPVGNSHKWAHIPL